MASDNVEIVQRLYDCFRSRDNETPFELYDDDIVWDTGSGPIFDAKGVYHGHEGVKDFWRTWLAAWSEIEFELTRLVDVGDGMVVGFVSQRNRGRDTGIWIEMPEYAQAWTLSGGKVIGIKYFSREEARSQFGL